VEGGGVQGLACRHSACSTTKGQWVEGSCCANHGIRDTAPVFLEATQWLCTAGMSPLLPCSKLSALCRGTPAPPPPTPLTCMQAAMQLSLLWLFHPGSCTSGAPRRTCTVNRRMPAALGPGAASFHSGRITMVGLPSVVEGAW
jgi:hypothetical protein